MTDFAAFVEESMPELLRFGHVLTGNSDTSRTLVRTALAGTPWRRVRTAADPVAEIRRAMAREYAGWASNPDGAAARADPLGGALATLSPRQRAVTILRYREGLSDQDAAHALGVKIPTAKNDATSALSQMRATFPEDQRPDAPELGRRLRDFLQSIDTDVAAGELTVDQVTRAARRVRVRRAAAATGGALAAGALIVGGVFVVSSGSADRDSAGASAEVSPDPSPTTLGGLGNVSVEGLVELTPDDFEGLAVGMTVAEVEAAFGGAAQFREQVPGLNCELQVDIGSDLTGWFNRWPLSDEGEPTADAEVILTEVAYYGTDAKTLAGVAVGMTVDEAAHAVGDQTVVTTPIGEGVHTAYTPPAGSWGVIGGIGYQVWPPPRCGAGFILGPEES